MAKRNPHKYTVFNLADDLGLKPQGVYGRLRSMRVTPGKDGLYGWDSQEEYRKMLSKLKGMPTARDTHAGRRDNKKSSSGEKSTARRRVQPRTIRESNEKPTKVAAAKKKSPASKKSGSLPRATVRKTAEAAE